MLETSCFQLLFKGGPQWPPCLPLQRLRLFPVWTLTRKSSIFVHLTGVKYLSRPSLSTCGLKQGWKHMNEIPTSVILTSGDVVGDVGGDVGGGDRERCGETQI